MVGGKSQRADRCVDRGRITTVVGRNRQRGESNVLAEDLDSPGESPLDRRPDLERLFERLVARELRVAQPLRQLEQRQRVTARALDQFVGDAGRRDAFTEEAACVSGGEATDDQVVDALGCEPLHVPFAGREQHRHGVCSESSRREDQCLLRLGVEPVRVVDDHEERRRGGQQAQARRAERQPIDWPRLRQPEHGANRGRMRFGE